MRNSQRTLRKLLLVTSVPVALATACSLLLNPESTQCDHDSDCAGRGFGDATCVDHVCQKQVVDSGTPDAPSDPKWGCIGHVTWPSPDPTKPVSITSAFRRLVGESPISGMHVYACPRLDPTCAQPVSSGTTDDGGVVTLTVFKGFDGDMRADPPPSFADMLPAIMPSAPPPDKDQTDTSNPVHLTSAGEMNFVATAAGKAIKSGLGHIFGLALDCAGNPTAGIQLKIDTVSPDTLGYYISTSGLPSATQGETSDVGEAGFVNVPPGYVTITATSTEKGKVGSISVLVKADSITYVPLPPTP